MHERVDGGAFVPGAWCEAAPLGSGPLDGLRIAVKDLIDVAGHVTGGGNPDWAAAQRPAARHAAAVQRLLRAGATVAGKTITDELAFSLEGENWHYGTPRNPRCPDSLPGGSSSGSAVAVAAGHVDAALGTDTGGSVRVPAAFCGLPAMRPTHGRIPLDGVLPFAPGYDTVGWFARDTRILERVGLALLGGRARESHASVSLARHAGRPATAPHPDVPAPWLPVRLLLVQDVFALTEPALASAMRTVAAALAPQGEVAVFGGRHADWLRCYQVLQGAQIRVSLGRQLERHRPRFGPAIAERFAGLAAISEAEALEQFAVREQMRQRLYALLQPGVVLVLPTTPSTALPKNADGAARGAFYAAALAINAIAGHAGLPQLVLPAGEVGGKPASLSFIAARGADELLLHHAHAWTARIAAASNLETAA
ncbi:amidase family protein [Oxalobacteraceae bacterium A2-2]